jgi:hypothetical protein
MVRPFKTEEEKRATKAAQNARYYSRHREQVLENVRARKAIKDRPYSPEEYTASRVRRNRNALEALHTHSHSYLQPITMAMTEMGLAEKLYKNEMLVIEEVFTMISAYFMDHF